MTHYVENVGTDDVVFIEVLQADHFSGMSRLVLVRSFHQMRFLTKFIDFLLNIFKFSDFIII